MGFSKADSKGGHQTEKFSDTAETQLVPLIIHTQAVKQAVIQEERGQEDFAPTFLGILDIPDRPRFSRGEQIVLTDHVNLKVKLPEKGSVELRKIPKEEQNQGKVEPIESLQNDNEFLLLGLEPEKTYLIKASLNSENRLEEQEKEIFLKTDSVVEFNKKGQINIENKEDNSSGLEILGENSGSPSSKSSHLFAYLLIGLVNLAGILIIAKILKKN